VQPSTGNVFSISALLNDIDQRDPNGLPAVGGGIGSSKDVVTSTWPKLMP